MSTSEYLPNDAEHIIHKTRVDFINRYMENSHIHVVQYDNSLPIIEVALLKRGRPYHIPDDAEINIKLCKPDGTFVYNPALGRKNDEAGNTVFFEVTYQMTTIHGRVKPVVEVMIGSSIAASGTFDMWIDKNPVQEGAIESNDEYKSITEDMNEIRELVKEAEKLKCNCKIATDEEIEEMLNEVFEQNEEEIQNGKL